MNCITTRNWRSGATQQYEGFRKVLGHLRGLSLQRSNGSDYSCQPHVTMWQQCDLLSIYSSLTLEQDPEILKFFHFGQQLIPDQERASYFTQMRSTELDPSTPWLKMLPTQQHVRLCTSTCTLSDVDVVEVFESLNDDATVVKNDANRDQTERP